MHLENRVGEKLVTVLLAMAANKYQERTNTRTLTQFAIHVQNVFNTKILGSMTRTSQWKLPMSVKGDQVSKVSFSNKKTCLVIDNITHMICFTFSAPEDEERKRIWMKIIQDYRDAMKILRKRNEYTAEDRSLFQVKINDFFFSIH
jgi:hypothetical protein